MKRLLTILFFIPLFTSAQFTFTPIASEIISPGRGAEQWHNSSARISNPDLSNPQGTENSLDVYYRKQWTFFEEQTSGNYIFDSDGGNPGQEFEDLLQDAIDNGQKLSFGIMTVYEGAPGEYETYDGARSAYPEYLHDLMQAEGGNNVDWISNGVWIPNWNSANYLGRLRALHAALNTWILSNSYTPAGGPHAGDLIQYKDAILFIDIRGYGQYGEWHSGGITDFNTYPTTGYPPGRHLTIATAKELIDLHTEEFNDWFLSMMIAGYNGGMTSIPIFDQNPEVAHYALTATNAKGRVGSRRDQWGAPDGYLHQLLEGNTKTFAGSATFGSLFLNLYKFAPGTGETMPGAMVATTASEALPQVEMYHPASYGNGNWGNMPANNSVTSDRIRAAWKRAGYRYELTGGSASVGSTTFRVLVDWRNIGVAPTYEDWIVEYKLKNGGGTVVWTDTSSFTPTLKGPDVGTVTSTDVFPKPVLADGTYSLYMTIKDTTDYRDPLPLAITGRDGDGSYLLGTASWPGVGPRPEDPDDPPPPPAPGEPDRIKWNRRFRAN